ncbi:MAG: trigger factor [Acidobacteriota bacterium]
MKLKTKLENISSVKKKLLVEISAEDAGDEFAKATNEFRKFANIPGFRPGKAPMQLIKSRFKEDLKSEVYKKLVPEAYEQAKKKRSLKPVGQPDLDNLTGEEGETVKFEAVFEVKPEIEIPEYRGLKLVVPETEVTDADVDKRLDELRESHAQLVAVEDRPIQDKDVVVIDMKGSYADDKEGGSGEEAISKDDLTVTVGDERTLKEFTDNLMGLNIGEEAAFDVEYAKDYPAEELADRKVSYKVEVTDIKAPELPELNDEFVKELGEYESLEKFREEIKSEMIKGRNQDRENQIRNAVIDKLIEGSEFEIPSALVESKIDERLKDFAGRLLSQGISPEKVDIDWAAYRESMRPDSERDVRAALLLEQIAEKEGIAVSKEEVDKEIETLSETYSQPVEKVRQLLVKDGNLEGLKKDIQRRKVFDLIIKESEIDSEKK